MIQRILHLLGSLLLYLYLQSLRIHITIPQEELLPSSSHFSGAIYAIWHDSLLILSRLRFFFCNKKHPIHIMISKSRDGNFPSFFAECFNYIYALRVAHTAKSTALKSAISYLMNGSSLLITPDGPRGPRRKVKGGIITASRASKRPIIPIAVNYSWKYSLSSWDQFQIPLPFSRVDIIFKPKIDGSENREDLVIQKEIEEALFFF